METSLDQMPSTEPEGHTEKMIDLVKKQSEQVEIEQETSLKQKSASDPSEKILGRFDSQEDLVAAFTELEQKVAEATPDPTPEAEASGSPEGKLNLADLQAHYATEGTLSEDHYASLEQVGITREIVDQYIAGQEATAARYQQEILSAVGGEAAYRQMTQWAQTTLTPDQLSAYNQAVESADLSQVKQAVQSLAYQYGRAQGSEPSLVQGKVAPVVSDQFQSAAQLVSAMADPRYKSDPAFRDVVYRKLSNSSL